jgi:hypothetical protein
MKFVRRVFALITLLAVALRGIISFLNWFEKQESIESVDIDDEEMEEAF